MGVFIGNSTYKIAEITYKIFSLYTNFFRILETVRNWGRHHKNTTKIFVYKTKSPSVPILSETVRGCQLLSKK